MSSSPIRVVLLTDAFVTESGRIVDGVANTLHRLARHFGLHHGGKLELQVFTHATEGDGIEDLGGTRVRRFRRMGAAAREYALSRRWDAVFDGLFEDYREVSRNTAMPSPRQSSAIGSPTTSPAITTLSAEQ